MRKVLYILGDLDDSDIEWLAANGSRRGYPQGAVLIQAGQPVSEIYILLDGELSVRSPQGDGQEIARLLPGEVVGELSFLDKRPPLATVLARTASSVLVVDREQLRDKLARDPSFAARFYRALGVFLASRLRERELTLMAPDQAISLREDEEVASEMDPDVLDQVALAGHRFEMLLERFRRA